MIPRKIAHGMGLALLLAGLMLLSACSGSSDSADSVKDAKPDPPPKVSAPVGYKEQPIPVVFTEKTQRKVGDATWKFILPEGSKADEIATDTWILPGNAVFGMNDDDLFVAPAGDRNHTNLYKKSEIPGSDAEEDGEDDFGGNLDAFPVAGYTGVLQSLDGAGYVVLLEEFGYLAPVLQKHADGFEVDEAGKLRVVFFADGGYNKMAQIIRSWMKEKGDYRNLMDKPYGEKLNGAVALRPVQHGAISKQVWEQIVPIIPKAILVWRSGDGEAAAELDRFSVEMQKELDSKGDYTFLPWAGMALPVDAEERMTDLKRYSFDKMPQSELAKWPCIVDGKAYRPDKGRGILYHPGGLKERMEYWLYTKMPQHPYTYRTDGANIDTLPYWFKPGRFTPCENPDKPAGFTEMVHGYEEMMKTVYDKGGIITHEGLAFFLEKYTFSGYGRPLVSIGANSGFYLKVPGRKTPPSLVLNNIANHVPINELVYHDQIAMRLHDAESLNMRYGNDRDTEAIRRYKFLFNALFGLTPNVQLGGEKADKWVTEDLPWLREEMPRATNTYRLTYGQAIEEHRFLTEDHLVQQTKFGNGVMVTANFDNQERQAAGMTVAPLDYMVSQ
ncbi:MAG: Carbohydrate binding domain protein [Paenibacillaceae bacterium]|nr:Carbohydrate binding domain protein [Paenibacillaceae bacterium]